MKWFHWNKNNKTNAEADEEEEEEINSLSFVCKQNHKNSRLELIAIANRFPYLRATHEFSLNAHIFYTFRMNFILFFQYEKFITHFAKLKKTNEFRLKSNEIIPLRLVLRFFSFLLNFGWIKSVSEKVINAQICKINMKIMIKNWKQYELNGLNDAHWHCVVVYGALDDDNDADVNSASQRRLAEEEMPMWWRLSL